jgi:hypothetical protein
MMLILQMGAVGRPAAVMLYGTEAQFDGEDIRDRLIRFRCPCGRAQCRVGCCRRHVVTPPEMRRRLT